MLKLYAKYLEVIDKYLADRFTEQSPFIHCTAGCTDCCEIGEYPFSRLEAEYLMAGFPKLPIETQKDIKNNIQTLLGEKKTVSGRFLHRCPFLINKKCALYERRSITCRAYGLASFEFQNGQKAIKFPECSKLGLNYSEVITDGTADMEKFHEYCVSSPVKHSLSLDFFEKELLKGFNGLEFGEIRPILDWFAKYD